MTSEPAQFLVLGATGMTGRHFTRLALEAGHRIRAVVRSPQKVTPAPGLEIVPGSTDDLVGDPARLDDLLTGVDSVVSMLGDAAAQSRRMVNLEFVTALVPAMRRQGVRRLLYQAGAFSAHPDRGLDPVRRVLRPIVARRFLGQHRDNEAVMRYLADEAQDVEWMAHRAALNSDGPSRGVLHRSATRLSLATFADCAAYNLCLVQSADAVHTADYSRYGG